MSVAQLFGISDDEVTRLAEGSKYVLEKGIPESVETLCEYRNPSCYGSYVFEIFSTVVGCHFGFIDKKIGVDLGKQGVSTALEYLSGKWITEEMDSEIKQSMEKSPKNEYLMWSEILVEGLLMAMILGDKAAIKSFAAWPEIWMKLDPCMDDALIVNTVLSICSAFRDKPMTGIEDLEAAVQKGRSKGPKLLFQTWDAGRSGNSAKFGECLSASLTHFEKTMETPYAIHSYIAVYQSLVYEAACQFGMERPKLDERLQARLITRSSLGITA